MSELDFSVIVPFFNSAAHLSSCIEALLDQDYPSERYEVILVDNGSSDRSLDILKQYPAVKLLRETRRGSYRARNLAVRDSTGECLVFTDSDCTPDRSWLSNIAKTFEDPEIGLLLGSRAFSNPSVPLGLVEAYELIKDSQNFKRGEVDCCYGYTNNMALRRQLFLRVGPFDEVSRGGDTLLVQRAVEEFGVSICSFEKAMRVTHLEVDSLFAYYKKMFLYGRSLEMNRSIRPRMRPLSSRERFNILAETVKHRPPTHGLLLCLVLGLGVGLYVAGQWTGRRTRLIGRTQER